MARYECSICGARGEDGDAFSTRGLLGQVLPVVACNTCDGWFRVEGVFRKRLVRLSEGQLAEHRGWWWGRGPGLDLLLGKIANGESCGEGAYTWGGSLIEQGRPFDRERMKRCAPMYTPFQFVCSHGHWIDEAVVHELTSRTYPETGIYYGFSCEPDDGAPSCSFDYQWAYQVWDAEPHPRDETDWLVESIIPDGVGSPLKSGN